METENKTEPGPQTDVVDAELLQGVEAAKVKNKLQGIQDFDDWKFGDVTVADCIAEKIPPKEILSTGSFWVNMSWLHIIALINRKSKDGKRINTQIKMKDFLNLYEKLMNKTFL